MGPFVRFPDSRPAFEHAHRALRAEFLEIFHFTRSGTVLQEEYSRPLIGRQEQDNNRINNR